MNYLNPIALGLMMSLSVHASSPSKYKKCPNKVNEPKMSSGYFWSNDCSSVFVLPPAINKLKIESKALNVTNQECSSLKVVVDGYAQKIKEIQSSSQQSQPNLREIKRIEKKIAKLNKNKESLASSRMKILEQKGEVRLVAIPINKEISSLEAKLLSVEVDSYEFAQTKRKLDKLMQKKKKIEVALERLDLLLSISYEKEKEVTKNISLLKESVENYLPSSDDRLERISALYQDLNSKLSDVRSANGGTVKILMESKHGSLVEAFKRRNRKLNIYKMPVESSIQFKISDTTGLVTDNLRNMNIPGAINDADEVLEGYTSLIFGESLSGSIDISALSACMLKWGEQSSRDLSSHFVVNLLNKYNLSIKNDYTLEYNLSDIYKKIKKKTSRGGFFKTSSVHSVSEYATQKGSFKLTFNSEDPRDNFDREEKDKIKHEFIARTLEQISKARIPLGTDTSLGLPQARRNGASVASEGIKKCAHMYCQIAGYALDLGNSLFGSEDVSSNYLRSQNYTNTETLNETKMYPQYMTSTFEVSN